MSPHFSYWYFLPAAIDRSSSSTPIFRKTFETSSEQYVMGKKVVWFQPGRWDQKAPRWSNMSFYLTVSRRWPLQPPLHQSSHSSHQYKCKSYNLVRPCGLWLSSRLSVQNDAVKGHGLIKFGRLPRREQRAWGDELTRLYTVKSNNNAGAFLRCSELGRLQWGAAVWCVKSLTVRLPRTRQLYDLLSFDSVFICNENVIYFTSHLISSMIIF